MLLRLSVFLLSLACYIECQHTYYDCRRSFTPCEGQCLILPSAGADRGSCSCPAGRTGYDCSINGAPATACNNPNCNTPNLQERLFCYTPTGSTTDQCACQSDYIGTSCDLKRVRVFCTTDTLTATVNPLPGALFEGRIRVRGQSSADCQLLPDSNNITYSRDITLGTCGTSNPTTAGGRTVYSVELSVQYDRDIQTSTDESHTVSCIHSTDGSVSGVVGVLQAPYLPGDNVTGNLVDVFGLTIERETAPGIFLSIADRVFVGDVLVINVLVLDNVQYQDLKVTQCTAYSHAVGNVARTAIPLISGSCPRLDAQVHFDGEITKAGNIVSFPLIAFKFDSSDELHIECQVTGCLNFGDQACEPETCAGTFVNGFGRKKRSSDNERIVSAGFKVTSRFGDNEVQFTCPKSTHTVESCAESKIFLAVTSVFGILLLVALLTSAFICFRVTRGQRPKGVDGVVAYSNKAMSTA